MSQSPDNAVYYSEYLQLQHILEAQFPESDKVGVEAHDEMLFIITHHAFELWFKQILFELDSVIGILSQDSVKEHEIAVCVHRLNRMKNILSMSMEQFTILETMTALDFMDFRDLLHPASGFQSVQFRILEMRLGLTADKRLNRAYMTAMKDFDKNMIQIAEKKTTLFEAVQSWLEHTPFIETDDYKFWEEYKHAVSASFAKDRADIEAHDILTDEDRTSRMQSIDQAEHAFTSLFDTNTYQTLIDAGDRRLSHKATLAALFIQLYRDYPLLDRPNELLQAICAFDETLSIWRYRHASMTMRMIGARIGTGGSSGFNYLAHTALKQRVFGDITSLAGMLIPRRIIPALPESISTRLQFMFEHEK
ncbi:MAG: tryptophan 2,3-dioxygenase family protein [Candidatus Kapaibacteriota bacterium]